MAGDPDGRLTAFQVEVAQLFFGLPASDGFLLAGGGALLAQGLTARPTQDLDFFTRPGAGDVGLARDQFLTAADEHGWDVDRVQDSGTFCRLLVHGPEDLLVDLALDSAPGRPAMASIAGPTFAPAELAGRKVIALFDRAAARDFVDVFALSRRFSKAELLELAREVDAGFEVGVFVEMIGLLARYSDADLELGEVNVAELRASSTNGAPTSDPSGIDASILPGRLTSDNFGTMEGRDLWWRRSGLESPHEISGGRCELQRMGRAMVVQHHTRKQPSQPTWSTHSVAVTSGSGGQPTHPTLSGKR